MRKTLLVSMLVVLLCSMNVSVVLADGEAPPLTWGDSTNDAGSQVDMSGLQGTEVQVQINTGSGGNSYAGGQGSQTETVTITVYQDPNKGGYFVAMDDTAAANAYQNGIIQGIVNASDGAFTTSSALQSSQTQANGWTANSQTALAGSTTHSGLSTAFITANTLHNNGTTVGFDQISNTAGIYTPSGAGFDAGLSSQLANNHSGLNLYTTSSYGTNNNQTSYTGQWDLFNSIDSGLMSAAAGINSLFGNTAAANAANASIAAYQAQNNYGKNNQTFGQQLLSALNPKNIINAVNNLLTTGKLGGNPTTYTQYVSPGTFGNQMQAAQQQLAMSNLNNTGATTIFLLAAGYDLSVFGFPSPGGGTPPGGTTPPPYIWIPINPPIPSCSYYAIIPGSIGAVAKHTAPPHPVVIGQDDQKRGVDLWWELTIGPTIEEWETLVVTGYSKQCNPFNPNDCVIQEEYGCELHRNYYCEPIAEASATATLSTTSKAWILEELSYKYPGATLKNPGFGYSEPAVGGCAGTTYIWTIEKEKVPVEDPGNWDMSILGRTRGTPVSAGRTFNVAGGRFPAFLIDTTIIR
ncbi:MAG: hypothetical protein RBT34_09700 [Anaerolineaceae bacterium]|jgi:hypothetical protein|nr:hypothetical protein [Anaerolineaceae bacterium]